MDLPQTLEWQRQNAPDINRLARLGDHLAKRLIAAYDDAYRDQKNEFKISEWMKICDDYVRRDLMIMERRVLQERFGHKPPLNFK